MKSREEEFYELAGSELSDGNYKVGLWNKAFSIALGDDAKTRALYMKFRVEEMEAEAISSAQRLSVNLDNQLSSGFTTPEKSAHQWNTLSKKAHQIYSASEYSKNGTHAETEATNHKGIKYYFGMLLCYIGAIIFIINKLYLFYAVISFAFVKFGVAWAIISFLAFPLTIAFGPIYLCSYTNDWWLIVNFALLLGFSSIIIGIGNVLTKPFKVKEKSTNPTQPKDGIKENGICDRYQLENKAIINIIKPLKNITVQDTDVFSIINFNGSPSYLQYPIEVSRASSVTNMLEFRIIDLIKLGYLKGVNHNSEWYIDIFQVNDQVNADHRTFHNLTNSTRSNNRIEENGGIESDKSTPPPLPSESSAEPPTIPEDSSPSKEKVYSIEETKLDSFIIIVVKIIISIVILLIAISFIFTAIEYLGSSSNSSLSSTIQATATPSQAATPPKVHSTLQVVSPQKLESFILKTETDLEIREEPTAKCKIIAKIPAKSYIISIKKNYTEQNGLEWSLITLGPYEGWVPKPLLSKITKYQK
jgi:hypothetical protein